MTCARHRVRHRSCAGADPFGLNCPSDTQVEYSLEQTSQAKQALIEKLSALQQRLAAEGDGQQQEELRQEIHKVASDVQEQTFLESDIRKAQEIKEEYQAIAVRRNAMKADHAGAAGAGAAAAVAATAAAAAPQYVLPGASLAVGAAAAGAVYGAPNVAANWGGLPLM